MKQLAGWVLSLIFCALWVSVATKTVLEFSEKDQKSLLLRLTILILLFGLSLLAFLEAFTRGKEKQRILLLFPCFLASFSLNLSILTGPVPFFLSGILILPACNLIRALNNQSNIYPYRGH